MGAKTWGNEFRTTAVCVDGYSRGDFSGRLYNPYLEAGARFEDLIDLLLQLEGLLDAMRFPQPFMAPRRFVDRAAAPADAAGTGQVQGKLATFAVRILFRQNATWQGSVSWLESGKEETFRSALELILLMHSALSEESPEEDDGRAAGS